MKKYQTLKSLSMHCFVKSLIVLFIVRILTYFITTLSWAPAGIFPGGQTFGGGGAKKSVKGGPHIFFRQALKYAYRGGGV